MKAVKLKELTYDFTVCKLEDYSLVNFDSEFCFMGKTDQENSLVCMEGDIPENSTEIDRGWKAFGIEGILNFSLIGILSKLSAILADNEIGIFAVSTFNIDYILVKKENFNKALDVLEENGYEIKRA